MLDESTLLALIGCIYDAAADGQQWPRFLQKISVALRAPVAAIDFFDIKDCRTGVAASAGIPAEAISAYLDYFGERNSLWPTMDAAGVLGPGLVVDNTMVFSDEEYARTEYCADYVSPYLGCFHAFGGQIIKEGSASSNLSLMRKRSLPLTDEERRFLRALMPHLQRSFAIHSRFAAADGARDIAEATIDQLRSAAIVVDEHGRVLLMNSAARRIAAQRDGLRVDGGRIAASLPAQTRSLLSMIGGASATAAGSGMDAGGVITIARPSGLRPLVVTVAPLPRATAPSADARRCAALFIADPQERAADAADVLRQVFALTAAEARVAALLLQGRSIKEAADVLGVTAGTARVHLKRVLQKTDTHRQADLVVVLGAAVSNVRRA